MPDDELGEAYVLVTPRLDRAGFEAAGRKAATQAGDGIDKGATGLFSRAKGAGRQITRGMGQGIGIGITQDIGAAVSAFAGEIVGMGASLERERNKVAIVFGDMLDEAEAWAEGNATAMGLTTHEATVMAAGIQDLVVPMGFARDAATDLTLDVADLAGALAEWDTQGRSAAEVGEILAKALLGERDALVSLGVKISEADVQTRLLEMGMKDATGQALEQARATATLQLLQEKSTDAVTAYNEGTNETTRAQNEARAAMQSAKEELATELQPAILGATQLGADLAGVVAELTGFLIENKDAVLLVAAAYTAYKGANALGGAISAMKAAEGAHGSLMQGMKRSITSAINPSALAVAGVTVAVGLLVKKWRDAAAARREFNKDAATVASALKTESGLVVRLGGDWSNLAGAELEAAEAIATYLEQDSRFKDRNQADDLERMGLTWEDLGEAIHGSEDAFRDFIERAVSAGEITLEAEDAMDQLLAAYREGPDALDDLVGGWKAAGSVVDGNTDLLRSFAREQDVVIAGLRNQAEGAITNAVNAGVLTEAMGDARREMIRESEDAARLSATINELAGATNLVTGETDDATVAVEELAEAEEDTEEATDEAASALDRLAESATEVEDAVDKARGAIDALTGRQVTLDEATFDLEESLDDLTDTLGENEGALDITTEAGRENIEAARDAATAIRDYELALINAGTPMDEARDKTDALRDALQAQLERAGFTADEVGALIDTYGEIPEEVRTAINADVQGAAFLIASIQARLDNLPRTTTIRVHAIQTGTSFDGGGAGRIFSRQHGGQVPHRALAQVGEDGPEVAEFPAGTRIHPRARARQVLERQGAGGITIGNVNIAVEGTLDLANPTELRRVGEALRDELLRLEDETA